MTGRHAVTFIRTGLNTLALVLAAVEFARSPLGMSLLDSTLLVLGLAASIALFASLRMGARFTRPLLIFTAVLYAPAILPHSNLDWARFFVDGQMVLFAPPTTALMETTLLALVSFAPLAIGHFAARSDEAARALAASGVDEADRASFQAASLAFNARLVGSAAGLTVGVLAVALAISLVSRLAFETLVWAIAGTGMLAVLLVLVAAFWISTRWPDGHRSA